MKFEDYHIAPELKRSIAKAGFKRPTDIQFKAIPAILKGEDVLAIAQTGTGKTAAFAIPVLDILHRLKNKSRPSEGIKCLVMVPTRELAIQITEVFTKIGQFTKVKSYCVFGGVEQDPQIAQLQKGVDILISTPGRMFDLVSQGHIKLDKIETLVLDEADHMLDLGFIKDIQDLIKFSLRPSMRVLKSSPIHWFAMRFASKYLRKIRLPVTLPIPLHLLRWTTNVSF
jgi:ATP-dependent RNA helicase RhlE